MTKIDKLKNILTLLGLMLLAMPVWAKNAIPETMIGCATIDGHCVGPMDISKELSRTESEREAVSRAFEKSGYKKMECRRVKNDDMTDGISCVFEK